MTTRNRPVCQAGPAWIRERLGKHSLGALTGQDASALHAFLHLVELYSRADDAGRRHAMRAMHETVSAMQPSTRHLARAGIPHVLDWEDEERLWRELERYADVRAPASRVTTTEATP